MVKAASVKCWPEPGMLKLNFGIMCLHILLMSPLSRLPASADAGFPAAEHWKVYHSNHGDRLCRRRAFVLC